MGSPAWRAGEEGDGNAGPAPAVTSPPLDMMIDGVGEHSVLVSKQSYFSVFLDAAAAFLWSALAAVVSLCTITPPQR